MDQGRGLGKGLGFGGQTVTSFRGLGSGEVPAESPGENFDARNPTMEPFMSSLLSLNFRGCDVVVVVNAGAVVVEVGGGGGGVSVVGEVRLATRPVDLVLDSVHREKKMEERTRQNISCGLVKTKAKTKHFCKNTKDKS